MEKEPKIITSFENENCSYIIKESKNQNEEKRDLIYQALGKLIWEMEP